MTMERVTAYKAYNGRLFESEDKCLAYEEKMRQYPKTNEEILPQIIEGINRVSVSYQKSPCATTIRNSYFLVADNKFKITGFGNSVPMLDIHNANMKFASMLEIIAAIMLNESGDVNDFVIKDIMSKFEENDRGKPELKLDTDNKTYWIIEDLRWHRGIYAPMGRYVKIEQLG